MENLDIPSENIPSQFGLRSLFALTATVSVLIVVAQVLCNNYPEIFIFALVAGYISVILGFGTIAYSGLLAFYTLSVPEENPNKKENLRRCIRLSLLGCLAFLPLVCCYIAVSLNPNW